MQRSSINIFAFLILVALSIAACGGGGSGNAPSQTQSTQSAQSIAKFSVAVKAGDINTAITLVPQDDAQRMRDYLQGLDNNSRSSFANLISSAVLVEEKTSKAVYKGRIVSPDNVVVEPTFIMVNDNGIWKITGL